MIYYVIFGRDPKEVMNLEGDAIGIYAEKDLRSAEGKAWREMVEFGYPFASIFTLTAEGPVKLSFLSLEDEVVKALGRWFK
ncbi:protein of unknown function [Thermococcus nautili]|uniref:hypothetical protein n=1 Tax=Thermococcus nautili TaxID=195522 RepID=UPI002553E0AC|nr:hypothetical protein [Thermococcus nautili]CAI1492039.1 protein of unknown function [Thermococcus nautili]